MKQRFWLMSSGLAVLLAAAFLVMSSRTPSRAAVGDVPEAKKRSRSQFVAATAPKPGTPKAIREFMQQKHKAMRQVMHGIVTEDYDLIQSSAKTMQKMATKVEWNIVQGDIYGDYSASFIRNAELLEKAAKEKNVDGAVLIYMQNTLNCIDCHKYTRGPNVRWKYPTD